MKKPPRRNATRKPIPYPRDAHVRAYKRRLDLLWSMDPEDWSEEDRALLSEARTLR